MKLILESVGTLKGRTITGVALVPTISLNGNIYSAEEIDAARNLNVPLRADWEHTDEIIGNVVYTLDRENHRLLYTATITDQKRASELQEGVHKVSIEANVDNVVDSCTRVRCYKLLEGLTLEGIGITTTPGVLQTTLNIVEKFQEWEKINEKHCTKCKESEADKVIKAFISDQIAELEKKIIAKYEMLQFLAKALEVDPNNEETKNYYDQCVNDLHWFIGQLIALKEKINVQSEEKIQKIIDEVKQIQMVDVFSRLKEKYVCKKCGKVHK